MPRRCYEHPGARHEKGEFPMQANSTITPDDHASPATATDTGPTLTTSPQRARTGRGARQPVGPPRMRSTTPKPYQAWLQRLDSRPLAGHLRPAHAGASWTARCAICRQLQGRAGDNYDAAGQPARWTARLPQIRQQMRAPLLRRSTSRTRGAMAPVSMGAVPRPVRLQPRSRRAHRRASITISGLTRRKPAP